MLLIKKNKQSKHLMACILMISEVFLFESCQGIGSGHKPTPADERAVVLAVLESIACSDRSPLPAAQYRPKLESSIPAVIVVDPKYGAPDRFVFEEPHPFELQEAVNALKTIRSETGGISVNEAHFPCKVQAQVNSKSIPINWETFRQVFPGGLAWVAVSRVGLNTKGDIAYIYSHAQWGLLQGESDVWALSRGPNGQWNVIQMYPVSRS